MAIRAYNKSSSNFKEKQLPIYILPQILLKKLENKMIEIIQLKDLKIRFGQINVIETEHTKKKILVFMNKELVEEVKNVKFPKIIFSDMKVIATGTLLTGTLHFVKNDERVFDVNFDH